MQIVSPLTIDAPAELVFRWITHRDKIGQWLPGLLDNQIIRETGDRIGTALRQVYTERRRRFEIPLEVTAYEPNRRLAVRLQTKKQDTTVDYRIHPHGGASRLVVETNIRFRGLMKVVGVLSAESIRDRLERRDRQQLGTLKRLCELDAGLAS